MQVLLIISNGRVWRLRPQEAGEYGMSEGKIMREVRNVIRKVERETRE